MKAQSVSQQGGSALQGEEAKHTFLMSLMSLMSQFFYSAIFRGTYTYYRFRYDADACLNLRDLEVHRAYMQLVDWQDDSFNPSHLRAWGSLVMSELC